MIRIQFYSQKAYTYFSARKASDIQIIDYFDIEVQKIIHYIGYRLKKNPTIEKRNVSNNCVLYYDLDHFKWSNLNDIRPDTINVVYECD